MHTRARATWKNSRAAAVAVMLSAVAACDVESRDQPDAPAGDPAPASRSSHPGGSGGAGGGDAEQDEDERGGILEGPCTGEASRRCKGAPPHCLEGRQECVDGVWSICEGDLSGREGGAR